MACGSTRTGSSRFDERISPSPDPPTSTRPRTPFSPRSNTPSWPERLPIMIDIIQEKLRSYDAANALEEENAVKEILQEIALYALRSEEHTSELQSLMRISYAIFCLKQ